MKTKFKILMLFSAMVLCASLHSQSLTPVVISAGGGYFASASASLSYTIAEMSMVQTFTSSGNILTQGFQQPEDISVSVEENEISLNDFTIYPNPTSGAFILDFNSADENIISIKIFNLVGQEIVTQNISMSVGANKISFDIGAFSQGIYIMDISGKSMTDSVVGKINLVY